MSKLIDADELKESIAEKYVCQRRTKKDWSEEALSVMAVIDSQQEVMRTTTGVQEMSVHREALEHFKWLRNYCNENSTGEGGRCPNCIFFREIEIDGQVYNECCSYGFTCKENVYDREVLPIIEQNLERSERQEKQ